MWPGAVRTGLAAEHTAAAAVAPYVPLGSAACRRTGIRPLMILATEASSRNGPTRLASMILMPQALSGKAPARKSASLSVVHVGVQVPLHLAVVADTACVHLCPARRGMRVLHGSRCLPSGLFKSCDDPPHLCNMIIKQLFLNDRFVSKMSKMASCEKGTLQRDPHNRIHAVAHCCLNCCQVSLQEPFRTLLVKQAEGMSFRVRFLAV